MFAARTALRPVDVVVRAVIVGLALATGYIHFTLGGLLFTLNAAGYARRRRRDRSSRSPSPSASAGSSASA